jgi:hypothetical protein
MMPRKLQFLFLLLVCAGICLFSCEKKKEGKLIVSEHQFTVRQDSDTTFTVDAKGKIKNVGEVDVKKVVVTGYCRSCTTNWVVDQWIITPEIEKMPEQKDIIGYISVGNEESFSFKEVTDMKISAGRSTPKLPEKLEIVIESFETVQ